MVLTLIPEHLALGNGLVLNVITKLGSSSPRPDTLTRFETRHMRRRSMYGRAKIDLLQARLIGAA